MAAGPQLKQQSVGKVLCLNDIHTAAPFPEAEIPPQIQSPPK